LFKTAVTKNRLSFFVSAVLSNRHEKWYFSYRLLKTVDTKNESLFLVTVEIISRHHKKS
jgi:hypothetical protein